MTAASPHIAIVDTKNGGVVRPITRAREDPVALDIGADGRAVFYSEHSSALQRCTHIKRQAVAGGRPKVVARDALPYNRSLFVSPDSKRVAYLGRNANCRGVQIVVLNLRSGRDHRWTITEPSTPETEDDLRILPGRGLLGWVSNHELAYSLLVPGAGNERGGILDTTATASDLQSATISKIVLPPNTQIARVSPSNRGVVVARFLTGTPLTTVVELVDATDGEATRKLFSLRYRAVESLAFNHQSSALLFTASRMGPEAPVADDRTRIWMFDMETTDRNMPTPIRYGGIADWLR